MVGVGRSPEEKGLMEMSQTPRAIQRLLVKKQEHDVTVEEAMRG